MALKYTAVYFWAVFVLCQVALFQCQVTLVSRAWEDQSGSRVDLFRIGEYNCTAQNTSMCASFNASCDNSTAGLCQCNSNSSYFHNPTIEMNNHGNYSYGSSCGCITKEAFLAPVGKRSCSIEGESIGEQAHVSNVFYTPVTYSHCVFIKAEVKYPNNNVWYKISWLDERHTYIWLYNRHRQLIFAWEEPVPELAGLLIILHLNCTANGTVYLECIKTRVTGTWTLKDSSTLFQTILPTDHPSTNQTTLPPPSSPIMSVTRDWRGDFFRVRDGSCTRNQSICTNAKASCDNTTGQCRCGADTPNFQNPTLDWSHYSIYRYGSSYSCVRHYPFLQRVGAQFCKVGSFAVRDDSRYWTKLPMFGDLERYKTCSPLKAQVKYPNSRRWHEIPWLDDNQIKIQLDTYYLWFRFSRPVPKLRGTVILIHMVCSWKQHIKQEYECIKTKIEGTWTLNGQAVTTTSKPSSTTKNYSSTGRSTTKQITTCAPASSVEPLSMLLKSKVAVAGFAGLVFIILVLVGCLIFVATRGRKRRRGQVSCSEAVAENHGLENCG